VLIMHGMGIHAPVHPHTLAASSFRAWPLVDTMADTMAHLWGVMRRAVDISPYSLVKTANMAGKAFGKVLQDDTDFFVKLCGEGRSFHHQPVLASGGAVLVETG